MKYRTNFKKKYNILLFGNYSYLNRGCEAIIISTANSIKKSNPSNRITLATFDKDNDENLYPSLINKYVSHRWEAELKNTDKLDRYKEKQLYLQRDVLREVDYNDICISVGGDNYCYRGNINFLKVIDEKARDKKKKIVLWGASINTDVVNKEFIRDIRRFDLVYVRESLTYKLLSRYVDRNKLILEPDAAFALEPAETVIPEDFKDGKGIVGLNISPLIFNYRSESVDIIDSVKKLIDNILDKHDFNIVLFPHVYKDEGNDLIILKEIKKAYQNEDRVILMDQDYSCNELKYVIAKFRFLIAARTHASIAGYSSGVPTLVLGYSIKSKGIARDIFGEYDKYVLPIEELSSEKLINNFDYIVKNEIKIKDILAEKIPKFKERSKNLFEIVMDRINSNEKRDITKKENCTGCSACSSSCPVSCIEMKQDDDGFQYPTIDMEKCTNCNTCRRVCPNNKIYSYKFENLKAFACKSKNKEERMKSSSGGVFSLLAKWIIKNKGVVFGVVYENYNVNHVRIETEEDLNKLRGSKYAESTIGDCYFKAKCDLDSGRYVLFSGTPCQIEGLKGYLRKDYPNLYCVSVVCHGVPSKRVLIEHIKEMEKEYGNKIVGINFRNKEKSWNDFEIEYIFSDKKIKRGIWKDEFMIGFLRDWYLRESCYECDFRLHKKNTADIILGDFWGIQEKYGFFDDDKGVSAVMINSEKGYEAFNAVKEEMTIENVDLKDVERHNPTLIKPVRLTEERFYFFDLFKRNNLKFAVDYFLMKEEKNNLKDEVNKLRAEVSSLGHESVKIENEKEGELYSILSSSRYKHLLNYLPIFDSLFPHGTARRKAWRMGFKGFFRTLDFFKKMLSWKKYKLVMTLLVKDEVDIVEHNIQYHLAHGVDFIVATDNGSTDGTRDVLLKYQKMGVLHLIDEHGKDHSQSKWVNRMAEIASKKYNADVLFHCDADEFWVSDEGDIKKEILTSNCDIMTVGVFNILMEDKSGKEIFPQDAKYLVKSPLVTNDLEEDSKKENLYFFRYPSKVIFRKQMTLPIVGEGNHDIINSDAMKTSHAVKLRIYHFPLRGKKEFFNKVIKGGAALELNKVLSKDIGWHWRRWYEAFKNNSLDEEYGKLILAKEEADEMKKTGMIEDFNFNEFIKK